MQTYVQHVLANTTLLCYATSMYAFRPGNYVVALHMASWSIPGQYVVGSISRGERMW